MTTKINRINEYLTFKLGAETFAFEIVSVKEVIGYTKITKVPRLPEHLSGIINLRGDIVSIVDVRVKLGINPMAVSSETCIIIVENWNNGSVVQTGVLVDSIKEVAYFSDSQVETAPKVGMNLDTNYLKGVAMKNDIPVLILDIEKIFAEDESNSI